MSKKRGKSPNAFEEPLEAHLREIAKGMAGKPLSEGMAGDSPLKQLIGRVVELSLDEELTEHLGYDRHEREPDAKGAAKRRSNTRNGYSEKDLKTSHGQTRIRVPRDRESSFEPQLVPKHRGISAEVEERVVSLYSSGMSTRDVRSHVEQLYGIDASEMFVSRVVERLDPELEAWRTRGLDDTYAILFIDAIHQKTRHNRTVRSTACYTVTGYGEAGILEILGVYTAPDASAESASFWHQVLIELQGRGVEQTLIVCADGLTGLPEAVAAVFPAARFQPCIVHLMRNTFRGVRWDDRRALAKDARRIYQAINFEEAEVMLEALDTAWGARYPASVSVWRKMLPKLIALYTYGKGLRKLVYTTNPIENVHRQMRKAFKTRGAMPNPESMIRLATLVLRKIDGKNQTRYRSDWPTIVRELHIHFPSLPENWGLRYQ